MRLQFLGTTFQIGQVQIAGVVRIAQIWKYELFEYIYTIGARFGVVVSNQAFRVKHELFKFARQ